MDNNNLQSTLNPASRWSPGSVIDWLFAEGRLIRSEGQFIHELATRMDQAGAPLERLLVTLSTLNPQVLVNTHTWLKSEGKTTQDLAEHEVRQSDRYIGSPIEQLYETKTRVRQRLDQLPVDAHRAYTELAADGFTDYLALPVIFGRELGSAVIVSTKTAGGFNDQDIENFRQIRSYLAPILEVYSLRHQTISLMNTYVGHRTGRKILDGMIRRGDADRINAALWFSDLRGLTHLTETLPTQQILDLLNLYFETVSASVSKRGGEILRFIGDAMLIVFPIDERITGKVACSAALDAANEAQNLIAALNLQRRRDKLAEIQFGVGLNQGEVVYGNVGAPDRLDFTVMGPAVNRTARLENLTKTLPSNILFSGNFAKLVDRPTRYLGDHEMKGIAKPQAVFALEVAQA